MMFITEGIIAWAKLKSVTTTINGPLSIKISGTGGYPIMLYIWPFASMQLHIAFSVVVELFDVGAVITHWSKEEIK